MKKLSLFLITIFSLSVIFTSCNKDEVVPADNNILPENFKVEIPASLKSSTKSLKSTNDNVLQGNEIYEHLTTFIGVGDEAAEIVSDIIKGIRLYQLSEPQSFTFTSNDDGRDKNVVIIENATFDGKDWQ
ncbi:MAG: hypothetical protein P1P88_25630, partial [Bacteroidales bacterium]|nr:hypothetical protein [Bacteroidales bacterium]